jgi:hypothetical protein
MNSRQRAKQWPYPRRKPFSLDLRRAAAARFASRGYPTHARMPCCLANWEDWRRNIILPEVAAYIDAQSKAAQDKKDPFPLHKFKEKYRINRDKGEE